MKLKKKLKKVQYLNSGRSLAYNFVECLQPQQNDYSRSDY